MALSSHTGVELRSEGPRDGVFKLAIAGRLDSNTTGGIWRRATATVSGAKAASVVVDASGIDYCDGAGIALLVHLRRLQSKAGGSLEIDGLRTEFANLLGDESADFPSTRPARIARGGLAEKLAKPQSRFGATFRSLSALSASSVWDLRMRRSIRAACAGAMRCKSPKTSRSQRFTDRGADQFPDGTDYGLSSGNPVASIRRAAFYRQFDRAFDVARIGSVDDRDHFSGPLGLGVRRGARHDESARRDRRAQNHGTRSRALLDRHAGGRSRMHDAAADDLRGSDRIDRRGGRHALVGFSAGHLFSSNPVRRELRARWSAVW